MGDWPSDRDFNRITISSHGDDSVGTDLRAFGVAGPASAAWPTANKALFVPFIVRAPFLAAQLLVHNGAAASGNLDAGIYDDQQNRIVSMGTTAQAGTSALQALDITDTPLQPGAYYMALAMDGTTGTVLRYTHGSVVPIRSLGVLMETSAFVLPTTAAFAAAVDAFVPLMAVTGRALV